MHSQKVAAMDKHSPKDIHLTGLKHGKETIAALLNVNADLFVALKALEEQASLLPVRDGKLQDAIDNARTVIAGANI